MSALNNTSDIPRIEAFRKNPLELPDIRRRCVSYACLLGGFLRAVAGGVCCLIGLALITTFWLLPAGLTLAFFGTALMFAEHAGPRRFHR